MQERSGAPVYMMEAEIPFSRRLWGTTEAGPFVEYLIRHGMGREMAEPAAAAVRYGLPLPEEILPLRTGERIQFGDDAARVIHVPGHADHQLVLHDERRGFLFAADHLLLVITPNIGLWPESEPHPLARYLESLSALRSLDAGIVLPGHGPVFHDLDGRIDGLLRHHKERLDLMRRVIESGPKTPYAVSREVFRGAVTLHQRCFALVETLAHLDHLALESRAERVEDGAIAFEGK